MKEQDSQEQGSPIGELIANLLRDRLASKLPESDLNKLISETKEIVKTSRISKLKDSIDYIEYKCREIERSLRHVRPPRERVFRDRPVIVTRPRRSWFDS